MFGQVHHFLRAAKEPVPYAIDRYGKEKDRLYGVLDRRLLGRSYIAGNDYTIADIACYPWIVPHQRQQQDLDEFPSLKRWFESIRERPATQRAYARGQPFVKRPPVMGQDEGAERGKTPELCALKP